MKRRRQSKKGRVTSNDHKRLKINLSNDENTVYGANPVYDENPVKDEYPVYDENPVYGVNPVYDENSVYDENPVHNNNLDYGGDTVYGENTADSENVNRRESSEVNWSREKVSHKTRKEMATYPATATEHRQGGDTVKSKLADKNKRNKSTKNPLETKGTCFRSSWVNCWYKI